MARTEEEKKVLAAKARQSRKDNPDVWREYDLRKSYGINLAEYNALLESQNFVCAICGNPEIDICNKKGAVRNLAVDHCHTTGKIRGLLCRGCNQGLGNFRDNPKFLTKAATYILNEGV